MTPKLPNYQLKKFFWKDYIFILLGTFMYALGITQFIMPHMFVTGGLTGIGILLNYAFSFPVSLTVLLINIVLIIIAWRILGSQFLIKTIAGVASLSAFLGMFEALNLETIMQSEPLIAGMVGAILCGVGIGLVFSVNGSTGGTDVVIMIVNKYRNVTPGRTMLFLDVLTVSASYAIFQSMETIVFGFIIIAIMTTSVDYVINGVRQSVQFLIFSKKHEQIATEINLQLNRGCTVLDAMGWYSKQPQKVLIVMAKRTESVSIFRIVKGVDPEAFVSQASVIGVYGEGFDKIR
ncbi:MAG: YitT family protein [Bacteroidia bacterium]|nr:YitT family protein [Bacteroidia bacterium]